MSEIISEAQLQDKLSEARARFMRAERNIDDLLLEIQHWTISSRFWQEKIKILEKELEERKNGN